MVIFNSYVKLPESTHGKKTQKVCSCRWFIPPPSSITKVFGSHQSSLQLLWSLFLVFSFNTLVSKRSTIFRSIKVRITIPIFWTFDELEHVWKDRRLQFDSPHLCQKPGKDRPPRDIARDTPSSSRRRWWMNRVVKHGKTPNNGKFIISVTWVLNHNQVYHFCYGWIWVV